MSLSSPGKVANDPTQLASSEAGLGTFGRGSVWRRSRTVRIAPRAQCKNFPCALPMPAPPMHGLCTAYALPMHGPCTARRMHRVGAGRGQEQEVQGRHHLHQVLLRGRRGVPAQRAALEGAAAEAPGPPHGGVQHPRAPGQGAGEHHPHLGGPQDLGIRAQSRTRPANGGVPFLQ